MEKHENGGEEALPIRGKEVSRCFVDAAFGIQFFEGGETTIRVEGRFSLRLNDEVWDLDPEDKSRVGKAAILVGKVVKEAVAFADGGLRMDFADGAALLVPPDRDYEAWEASAPGGFLAVSTAGGGLSVWRADFSP